MSLELEPESRRSPLLTDRAPLLQLQTGKTDAAASASAAEQASTGQRFTLSQTEPRTASLISKFYSQCTASWYKCCTTECRVLDVSQHHEPILKTVQRQLINY